MERSPADPVRRSPGIEKVVLVHGLWTPSAIMRPIGRYLRRRGYAPRYFRYRGRDDFDRNADLLARFIATLGEPAHCVGHSLGGLLLLRALGELAGAEIGRTVLIASPVRGAAAARRLAGWPLGRWLMGRSQAALCAGIDAHWRRPEPLGLIVGTGRFGLGRLLGPLEGVNDGVVREPETSVEGSTDTLRIPLAHTPILFSARVACAVADFLDTGRFTAA